MVVKLLSGSIFERFWLHFGLLLGGKIDQKSIQEGIEKALQKRRAHGRAKNRNKSRLTLATGVVQSPGEGVGGEVNLSQEGCWKLSDPTAKPP